MIDRKLRAFLVGLLIALAGGCGPYIRYSDDLWGGRDQRSDVVQVPSRVGGSLVGAVVGVPVAILASPLTYGVYAVEREQAPLRADLASNLGAPAFFFWRAGTIVLGAPFDLLELAFWRAWRTPPTPNRAEREAFERSLDFEVLPSYPVETIYPAPDSPPDDPRPTSDAGP